MARAIVQLAEFNEMAGADAADAIWCGHPAERPAQAGQRMPGAQLCSQLRGAAVSGLFDLEPIRLCYLNDKLGLDAEEARRNSPLLNLPARAARLIIAYGSDELPELKRQSREFGAAWSTRGLPGDVIEVADCHHYAVLEQLAKPDGLLAKALAATDRG